MAGGVFDAPRGPAGYANVAVGGAATVLPVPAAVDSTGVRAKAVLLMARTATAYWRDDGVVATTVNGFPLPIDREFYYTGDPTKISIIGDASSVVHCSFYF